MYQSNLPQPPAQPSTPAGLKTRANVVKLNHASRATEKVSQFPTTKPIPAWLKSLLTIQKGSAILCGTVLILSAIAYGYTLQTQNTWKQQYGKFHRLNQQGTQQDVMDGILKHQTAAIAEQDRQRFQEPNPQQSVVIPSVQPRPTKSLPSTQSKLSPVTKPPQGY